MPEQADLRIAVLQPGARLHYAVPALLERAGMLQCFYTDFCASVGPLRHLARVLPEALRPAVVRRAMGRMLPSNVPRAKVRHIGRATILRHIARSLGVIRASGSKPLLKFAQAEQFGGANAIYTVIVNDDLDLCHEARARGCKIIHEVMLNPDIGLWLNEEYELFPEVRRNLPPLEEIYRDRERDRRKYEIADLILVPSDFVYRSVLELGADPSKVMIVPYGIDESWLQIDPRPVPGRVLFVGSVGLLKGSHYLAKAVRLLASREVSCDVRVVGPLQNDAIGVPLFAGPGYVGQVPRSQIRHEFSTADVFVLPTLCEGFGLVHLEALACGVPVITTPNCGSVVRNGIDGIIVPVRNPGALADAIERIITNPELRATMSRNARARALEFTWQHYGERLIDAISRLQPTEAIS